jgi:hypothetical protein
VILNGIVKVRVLPVAGAAAVEAVEADIQTSKIILCGRVSGCNSAFQVGDPKSKT